MIALKTVIDSIISILSFEICLFGYDISLMNVAVYTVLGSLILTFIFRLFK